MTGMPNPKDAAMPADDTYGSGNDAHVAHQQRCSKCGWSAHHLGPEGQCQTCKADADAGEGFEDVIEALEMLPAIIRETRRRKGQSVRAAAAELKVAHASLLNWERHTQQPGVDMAIRILRWAAT